MKILTDVNKCSMIRDVGIRYSCFRGFYRTWYTVMLDSYWQLVIDSTDLYNLPHHSNSRMSVRITEKEDIQIFNFLFTLENGLVAFLSPFLLRSFTVQILLSHFKSLLLSKVYRKKVFRRIALKSWKKIQLVNSTILYIGTCVS